MIARALPFALVALLAACPRTGAVCPVGQKVCQGACRDLQSDPSNCGECGRACGPSQVCVGGACACESGAAACPDACAILESDPSHCGRCDRACAQGQVCEARECKQACEAPGAVSCAGSCADVQVDAHHCGACDRSCGQGQRCASGRCTYDLVAACTTLGLVVGLEADAGTLGPATSFGSAPQALAGSDGVLLSVDAFDRALYGAPIAGPDGGPFEAPVRLATVGATPNQVLWEGTRAYVVSSAGATLQILERRGGDAGVPGTFSTVGELNLGANTFPNSVVKLGDRAYVTLTGGAGGGASAGEKIAVVDVSDPTAPSSLGTIDLSALPLHPFPDAGIAFGRPFGIAATPSALYVAIDTTDEGYQVVGPGLLAIVPLDGGSPVGVDLGADHCLDAIAVALHGDDVVVSCAGDSTRAPPVSAVLLMGGDGRLREVKRLDCPGSDGGCTEPAAGRLALRGDRLVVADQAAGRLFVYDLDGGSLVDRFTLQTAPGPWNVCPVNGATGYSNVGDVLALP